MKTYYLRFTESDFTKTGSIWKTSVVDLYSNSQYKNYSTTKSAFGLNSLGNGTWTGLNRLSATTTEYGVIEGGTRFIDLTGRIDIVDWAVDYTSTAETTFPLTLSVYTSESSTNTSLNDWTQRSNIVPGGVIFVTNSNRYAFFEINWNTTQNIATNTITLYIRVEIDSPGINAMFPETLKLMNKFPEWMALREYDPTDPSGSNKATPTSVGGKIINALSGEWLNDIHGKIEYTQFQSFIATVDLDQKAWVYESTNIPAFIYSITGDGVQLARVSSIGEFYDTLPTEDAFLWNEANATIYCNKKYTNLLINGVKVDQGPYHTWNSLDDIGLTVDLFRLQLESNEDYKSRILDVYKNTPGVSVEAFKKALRRELNLWKYWGSTPNSDFFGATPHVYELQDLETNPEYFEYNGMPKGKFLELAEMLAQRYPMTWGYFKYGQAFWDADGLDHLGMQTIPKQLDATPVSEGYIESGVGDGNDMYIMRPDAYTGARDFTAKLKIRGRQKSTRQEYPGLEFKVKIYGLADETQWSNAENSSNFTLELTIGGVIYYHNFTMTANSNVSYWQSTPSFESLATFIILNEDSWTDVNTGLYSKTTNALYGGATPSQASYSDITKVEVKPGHFNFGTGTYINAPTQANYRLWFSDNFTNSSAAILGNGGSATSISITSFNTANRNPVLVYESRVNSSMGVVQDGWQSTPFEYNIKINGAAPAMGLRSISIPAPPIPWPSSTSDRRYIVQLLTSNGTTTGAYSDDLASTPFFLPDTYLTVNGTAAWSTGVKSFASTTTSFTFASTTGAAYPVTVPVWTNFEAEQIVPLTGTVDQNGPWRNDEPQYYGNTSYVLDYYNLTRDHFGIANTQNYIVTWLGVSSISSPQVLVWVDTNTVKPAVVDYGETNSLTYPDTAIVEEFNPSTSKYEFNGIVVKARYKPGVTAQWYPKAHSGYFYDDTDEYYMYSERQKESTLESSVTLSNVNRQGAPVIVRGNSYTYPGQRLIENEAVLYMDAAYSVPGEQTVVNRGTAGSMLNAQYGSSAGSDVADPLLFTHTGTNYLYLPGTIGNYTSTTDSGALSITNDLTLDFYGAADDWTPAAQSTLIAKSFSTGNQRSYALLLGVGGLLMLRYSTDGIAATDIPSTVATGLTDGSAKWVRVSIDVDDNSGNRVTRFWTADAGPDGLPIAWAQLGATVTQVGPITFFDSTADVTIGARNTSGSSEPFAGKVYRARIYNSPRNGALTGTPVYDVDFTRNTAQTSFTCSTGQTVTINRSTSGSKSRMITQPGWAFNGSRYFTISANAANAYVNMPGTSGTYISTPDSTALSITGDLTIDAKIAPDVWNSVDQTIVSKYTQSGNQRSYRLTLTGGGFLRLVTSVDGVSATTTDNSTVSVQSTGVANGAVKWVRATIDVNDGGGNRVTKFYLSDNGSTWTQLGSTLTVASPTTIFDSTSGLEIGARDLGVTDRFTGKIYAVKIYNSYLQTSSGSPVAEFVAYGLPYNAQAGHYYTGTAGGHVYTLRGAATLINGHPLNMNVDTSFSVVIVTRRWDIQTATGGFMGSRDGTSVDRIGWEMLSRADHSLRALVDDGPDLVERDGISTPIPVGTIGTIGMVVDGNAKTLATSTGGTLSATVSTAAVGNITNTADIWIGRSLSAGYLEAEIFAVLFFRRALLASELAQLNTYFQQVTTKPYVQPATPTEMRQVTFFDEATPVLSLVNTETIQGNGGPYLYAAYRDIYDITVKNLTTNTTIIPLSTSTTSNIITLPTNSDLNYSYKISYKVNRSFYIDNEHESSTPPYNRSHLVFDKTPHLNGLSEYEIYYEGSTYDPATPIDIPLNTFYTSIDEGFIYIDHDVHDLSKTEVHIDPTKIIADGSDYSLITVRTYDIFGNPKPYQTYNLYTNYGVINTSTVTTDRDGFAHAILMSYPWNSRSPSPTTGAMPSTTPNLNDGVGGTLRVVNVTPGATPSDVTYSIHTHSTPNHTLVAVPSSDQIPADGKAEVYVKGRIQNAVHAPVSGASVFWKKARYMYDLFQKTSSSSAATPGKTGTAGRVFTDSQGRFTVGPFIAATPSDPGIWLVSVEASGSGATPYSVVGDVVYWYEYSDTSFGVENISGVPKAPKQYATPPYQLPDYNRCRYPVNYDEQNYEGQALSSTSWQPPAWYAVDRYGQYQMGILGNDYWSYSQGATPHTYPDYKEF